MVPDDGPHCFHYQWSPTLCLCTSTQIYCFVDQHCLLFVQRSIKWQKLFTYTASELLDKPTELAWRPDGKTLAIGHSNGAVSLLNMETGDIQPVPRSGTRSPVGQHTCSSLHWVASHIPMGGSNIPIDRALTFLPPMAALNDQTFIQYEASMQTLPKSTHLVS